MPSLPFDNTRSPRFLKVFLPGLTSQNLGIPPAFWKHTNRLSTGTASLQGPSGNIWPVNLITKEGHTFFENGWQEFVRDHSIKCGNVLVFRYDGDSHFKVQVFDSSGCEKEDCFSVKPCEDAIMSQADGDTQNTRQTAVVFPASWSGKKNAKMKGRARAFERACSFGSNYPTVVVVIHDSYDKYLKLPNAFFKDASSKDVYRDVA
ncbi:hypothetical protein QJS10_CPB15g01695 [Acorus calamus]|uniref:TF-B3 domain-containing protein n=1 Tax=Acorus calamus TaxID=4465 RepID=A0AAV9D5Y2_ACOCL|nr:hypothetical protein QJS10_CPB15g01695 [Acorus calamus]